MRKAQLLRASDHSLYAYGPRDEMVAKLHHIRKRGRMIHSLSGVRPVQAVRYHGKVYWAVYGVFIVVDDYDHKPARNTLSLSAPPPPETLGPERKPIFKRGQHKRIFTVESYPDRPARGYYVHKHPKIERNGPLHSVTAKDLADARAHNIKTPAQIATEQRLAREQAELQAKRERLRKQRSDAVASVLSSLTEAVEG